MLVSKWFIYTQVLSGPRKGPLLIKESKRTHIINSNPFETLEHKFNIWTPAVPTKDRSLGTHPQVNLKLYAGII